MRWWPVLAVAVVSSALAVVINLATDSPSAWPLWAGVALLTVLSAAVTHYAFRPRDPSPDIPPAPPPPAGGEVRNTIHGTASGTAVQARDITGGVHLPGNDDKPQL
jgi:hypothetical protein